jgi:hypothetical protein
MLFERPRFDALKPATALPFSVNFGADVDPEGATTVRRIVG